MRCKHLAALAGCALAITASDPAVAADHFDGPLTTSIRSIDINGMFVFPSPQDAKRLVLVLNSHPGADHHSWFSNVLDYRFRIRPVSIAATGDKAGFTVGETEIAINCVFSDLEKFGDNRARQHGSCGTDQRRVDFTVGRATPDAEFAKTGMRVFTGRRLEPFFVDVEGTIKTFQQGKLEFSGENSAANANALSIVIEIDTSKFLPDPSGMYGVVSEVASRGKPSITFDTFGRPEVTNVILSDPGFDSTNKTVDLRDLFNRMDPFAKPGPYAGPFTARINANLHKIDKLDGQIDWPLNNGAHPLTELQMADYTVIDLSKPFGQGNWFEIEKAIIEGRPHTTGGGRWLDDDIVDIQLTFLVARDRKKIGDGVDKPTRNASRTFPYLREPITKAH